MTSSTLPKVDVNIRSIAFGGEGVGEVCRQHDGGSDLLGITAFVPYAAPGEIVSVALAEHKQRYVRGQLLTVQNASPNRVVPTCPYYSRCGGCDLQHLAYDTQLSVKLDMLRSALRAGRIGMSVVEKVRSIVPTEPYGYRRRVTLHVNPRGQVGFYRTQSRTVVPIDSCAIASLEINALLVHIQDFGREVRGVVSSIIMESDADGVVVVLKCPAALQLPEKDKVIAEAKKYFSDVSLLVGEREVGGYGRQILSLPLNTSGSLELRVPAGNFSQVNWDINRALVERVVDIADIRRSIRVWDLYAGAGNFALPLAKAGATVIAVECDPRLVSFGRENAIRYHLENSLQFVNSSVEHFMGAPAERITPELIIADPPRSGLGTTLIEQLPSAERLMLISCHLPSFVRDIRAVIEHGWEVEDIEPFDMFAQTSYMEILSVLKR